jgi:hypothetical protein
MMVDAEDVTEGPAAFDAFVALVQGGHVGLSVWSGEDAAGEPCVIIESEAETLALDVTQAMAAAILFTRTAHGHPNTDDALTLLDLSDCLHDALRDLVGSGEAVALH